VAIVAQSMAENVELLSHCSKGYTAVTAGSVACISLRVSLVNIQL